MAERGAYLGLPLYSAQQGGGEGTQARTSRLAGWLAGGAVPELRQELKVGTRLDRTGWM